jgi:hypothetical protein
LPGHTSVSAGKTQERCRGFAELVQVSIQYCTVLYRNPDVKHHQASPPRTKLVNSNRSPSNSMGGFSNAHLPHAPLGLPLRDLSSNLLQHNEGPSLLGLQSTGSVSAFHPRRFMHRDLLWNPSTDSIADKCGNLLSRVSRGSALRAGHSSSISSTECADLNVANALLRARGHTVL